MKKLNKTLMFLLLTFALLFSSTVFAVGIGDDTSFTPIPIALLIEAFVSIHMTVFVLIPLSKLISENNSKKVFWIMFFARIAILLIFDFFITTSIFLFDFFAIFAGAFIIMPLSSVKSFKSTAGDMIKMAKSITLAKEDTQENVEIIDDGTPVVEFDNNYLKNEKVLLKEMIVEQMNMQGEDIGKFVLGSCATKKNYLLIVLLIVSFICSLMFLFNTPIAYCLLAETIALIVYIIISSRFSTINTLMKQAKKNPDKEIFQIVAEAKMDKREESIPRIVKVIAGICIAITIPCIIFSKPTILYLKYGRGYSVFKYTRDFTGSQKEVIIPDTYKGKDVIAIGENAFRNTNVEKVILSKNIETIKTNAFYNCQNLEKINIPRNVFEIRASAFENCYSLENISLPEGLKDIRARAFANNYSLKEIELPAKLEYLGAGAFACCSSLKEVTIPEGVTEINGQTFAYCIALTKINMHDNIVSIHGETFMGDILLDNVILPSKITEIKGNTFEGCASLSSIVIPEGVTRIGGHAFYGCKKLKSVTIPSTLKEIGSSAFRQCRSLQEISVPRGTVINERSFKESPTKVKYI